MSEIVLGTLDFVLLLLGTALFILLIVIVAIEYHNWRTRRQLRKIVAPARA
ncbi:hypothetical protein [Thermofilum pendens]|uniref:hypothetical protein n=1 Tax=Thermofilum pendens TaxID=2269 RepID=UPI0003219798|nr:hypothetical protein [Thermofilum pendens]